MPTRFDPDSPYQREMARRASKSSRWYSDDGDYMRGINERLQSRPPFCLVDEEGLPVNDDPWSQ